MLSLRSRTPPPTVGSGIRMLAGPLLIVGAVLVILRHYVGGGIIATGDVLDAWLPNFCFMGRTLAAGHVPAWNPHVFAGIPFAADPLNGWMNLPAMTLFTALPCAVAIRSYIVLLPILAGLGIYGFLRTEGTSRPSAAAGGVVLSLLMADALSASISFAGALAWTALLLAAVAKYVRASTWSGRLAWLALVALAWGQLAAAHLNNAVALGTEALVVYLAIRMTVDVRTKRRSVAETVAIVGLLVVAIPLVNLAYLLPRLGYLPRTTVGLGYRGLQALDDQLAGLKILPGHATTIVRFPRLRLGAAWPLGLTRPPGAYLGAAASSVSLAGWGERRLRPTALFAASLGALSYVATLPAVADWANVHIGTWPLVNYYLHDPTAFRYGVVVALAALVGLGVESVRNAPSPRRVALLLAPGLLIWWVLPLIVGVTPHPAGLFLAGMAGVVATIGLTQGRRRVLAVSLVAVVAIEMGASGWFAEALGPEGRPVPIFPSAAQFPQLGAPVFSASAFVEEPALARELRARDTGRYISYLPGVLPNLGYYLLITPKWWGLLANQRSMLFGLEDAQGYNSIQPLRLWEFNRSVNSGVEYQFALFHPLTPIVANLLQIVWLIAPIDSPPVVAHQSPIRLVAGDGQWGLYRLPKVTPRASVVTSWKVVRSAEDARRAVVGPFFSPVVTAILERDPGVEQAVGGHGTAYAVYRPAGQEGAVVSVDTPTTAVVLIRNSYDPNWHATVDGKPTPVLAADYVVQGVPVRPGRHVIRLFYDDPNIGHGLLGSFLALAILFGVAFSLRSRANETKPFLPIRGRRPTRPPAANEVAR
jgi:hypothetical protein